MSRPQEDMCMCDTVSSRVFREIEENSFKNGESIQEIGGVMDALMPSFCHQNKLQICV